MVRQCLKALILCGPSGAGKSTLLRSLFDDFPNLFGFSVSHTTRSPRPGEVNGQHYHFTTKEDMEAGITKGEFLETAIFSNNMYGTSKKAVEDVVQKGQICVLDIDVQGVKQIKQTDLKAVYVFVKPPSYIILEKRLRERGTESEDAIQRRLKVARDEVEYSETPGIFDLVIVNDVFEKSYSVLRRFVVEQQEKRCGESNCDYCNGSQ